MLKVVRLLDKSVISNRRKQLNFITQLFPTDNHEHDYLLSVLKDAYKGRNTLYVAVNENDEVFGVVALSLNKPKGSPDSAWLVIEYLYVLPQCRGLLYNDSGLKVSAILMAGVLRVALKIHDQIELDTIALELAHDKLVSVYEEFGFEALRHLKTKHWMGLKVDEISI